MSKLTKKTGTTALSPYTRDQVPVMIEKLKAQLAELKGNSSTKSSTNGRYEGLELKDCTVTQLATISAKVTMRTKALAEEYKRYGLKKHPAILDEGYTAKQWYTDIEIAINTSVNKQQIAQVEKAIKALEPHLGEDEKFAKTMESIMSIATADIK